MDRAWETVLDEFPPPGVEPVEAEPVPVEPDPPAQPTNGNGDGLAGLGDIPSNWPTLPSNAAFAAEVQWVQANRLSVRRGDRVDLSQALMPAPSRAALSWLAAYR